MPIFNTILNILFGTKCIVCQKADKSLCKECASLLPKNKRECPDWIFPIYDYTHPSIKKCIKLLKYKRNKEIAEILTENSFPYLREEQADLYLWHNFTNPIIIPIPISNKKRKIRGYNQTEILAQKITSLAKETFTVEKNILIKKTETPSQTKTKNKIERLNNPKKSFLIKNPEKIKDKNILLVDDVLTTGATLNEARKILLENGAKKVFAFTLAH